MAASAVIDPIYLHALLLLKVSDELCEVNQLETLPNGETLIGEGEEPMHGQWEVEVIHGF